MGVTGVYHDKMVSVSQLASVSIDAACMVTEEPDLLVQQHEFKNVTAIVHKIL